MLRDAAGPLEASIFVEALRAIPAALVAAGLIAHALLWAIATHLAEPSPPPQMAMALALGREWLLGYPELPPLAAWISEAIYRATGSLFVLRLAATLCVALAGWLLFQFARRVLGDRQGALAVLIMVSVFPVAFPGGTLSGDLLQMPLIAAAILFWWIAVAEKNPNAWMPLALMLAISVYAGPQGIVLAAVLFLVTLLSARGRDAVASAGAVFAIVVGLLIFAHIAGPRLCWLWFNGAQNFFPGPGAGIIASEAQSPLRLLAAILIGHFGFALLVLLASLRLAGDKDSAPVFGREPVDPLPRWSVIALAVAPALLALLWLHFGNQLARAHFLSPLLLLGGVAVVLAAGESLTLRRQVLTGVVALILLVVPPFVNLASSFRPGWIGDNRAANWPAAGAARIFADIYRTRTGRPLEFVAGERIAAAQIAMLAPSRPHLVIDADVSRSPWIDAAAFKRQGGVVFWEIRGADSAPPPDYVSKLPAFVTEAPLRLPWARGGGEPVRLGWAIVPPAQ
jgi:4-amino-4-deoxy-L-arabinose transferase-like glycosyltransferase